MAVHIGEAIRERVKESGMTVTAFASRIGRTPQNVHKLFRQQSWDTHVVRLASEALGYNFFHLLSMDIEKGKPTNMVAEAPAQYGNQSPTVIIVGGGLSPEKIKRITEAAKGS